LKAIGHRHYSFYLEVVMSKALSRNLYLIALGVIIVAAILLIAGLAGSTTTTDANGYTRVTSIGNPALFGIAIFLFVVGGIVGFVAYIGALIKMATLGRWGWFVCLLLISGITMLVYMIAGPETRPYAQVPPPMGYVPQPYPPQGYPQWGNPPPGSYPQQGYPQQGNPPAGYPQAGNPQSGGPPADYPRQ
jgi:hypothetical protein